MYTDVTWGLTLIGDPYRRPKHKRPKYKAGCPTMERGNLSDGHSRWEDGQRSHKVYSR